MNEAFRFKVWYWTSSYYRLIHWFTLELISNLFPLHMAWLSILNSLKLTFTPLASFLMQSLLRSCNLEYLKLLLAFLPQLVWCEARIKSIKEEYRRSCLFLLLFLWINKLIWAVVFFVWKPLLVGCYRRQEASVRRQYYSLLYGNRNSILLSLRDVIIKW